MTMIDNIDISDICMDIDAVGLYRDRRGKHHAAPFVIGEDGDFWESDHDLTDYPAVLAVCRRKFDPDDIKFEPPTDVTVRMPTPDEVDDDWYEHEDSERDDDD